MSQISYKQDQQQNPNPQIPNQTQDNEINLYPFQLNPISSQNTSFSPPIPNPNRPFSDTESNPDSIDENSDTDQINFVTDLFSTNEQYPHPNFTYFEPNHGFRNNIDLGFGTVSQLDQFRNNSVFESTFSGLRVVGLESESESESDSNSETFVMENETFDNPGVPLFWDENRNVGDFEWEEVRGFERDELGSVIERIEELSVSSELSNIEREESNGDRDLEWEFLLAVNNLERNSDFENDNESFFGEYDELFGQLMQNAGNGNKGSPPAAKSFVENLPVVVLIENEFKEDNYVVCAICKDDLMSGSDVSVTKLPCCHLYHQECIVPWLCIRNTCPVCRYELPTDDVDYERRKSSEGEGEGEIGFSGELLVRYAFEPIL